MYSGLLKRTSVRSYLNKPIEQEKIDKIKNIINLSPTSMNTHGFSAIFVTDHKLKEKIANLNWQQKHIIDAPILIIFCADFNRINIACKNYDTNYNLENIEKLTLGVVDATIAAGMVVSTADELDLATCFIGGIRYYADQISGDLNLEGDCTPVLALTIGYADKIAPLRPKINKVYLEKYNIEQIKNEIIEYDATMLKYYESVCNKSLTWTKATVDGMSNKKLKNSDLRSNILKEQFGFK